MLLLCWFLLWVCNQNLFSTKDISTLHYNQFLISVEHILHNASQVHYVLTCEKSKNPLLEHVNYDVPHLFTGAEEISIVQAIFAKSISISVTFVWSYLDIFIMTIGIALTSQFKLFNDELNRAKGEVWTSTSSFINRCRYFFSLLLNIECFSHIENVSGILGISPNTVWETLRFSENSWQGHFTSHLVFIFQ